MKHHIDLEFFKDINQEILFEVKIESDKYIGKKEMIKFADQIADSSKSEDDPRKMFYNIRWEYK